MPLHAACLDCFPSLSWRQCKLENVFLHVQRRQFSDACARRAEFAKMIAWLTLQIFQYVSIIRTMKRTAAMAGLPWFHARVVRMDVVLQDSVVSNNEVWHFHLQLGHSANVDGAKKMLVQQVYQRTGYWLRPRSFRLEQNGVHLGFMEPITNVRTLVPVYFVRTNDD